jgi:hypothetical protein
MGSLCIKLVYVSNVSGSAMLPCVYMVVSRATTGFFVANASRTSSETLKKPLLVRCRLPALHDSSELRNGSCGLTIPRERSLIMRVGREEAIVKSEVWRLKCDGGAEVLGAERRRRSQRLWQNPRSEHDASAPTAQRPGIRTTSPFKHLPTHKISSMLG